MPKGLVGSCMEDSSPVWTTRDGARIRVSEMDDNHICNALAWVLRKSKEPHYIGFADPFGNDHYCDQISGEAACKDGVTLKEWERILKLDIYRRGLMDSYTEDR